MQTHEPELKSRELSISRVIDASRERIFEAWTDPAQLAQWWAPPGFTTPVVQIDPRPGGLFHTVMRDGEGKEYPVSGVFLDVVAPERIVFCDGFRPGWIPNDGHPFMTAIVTLEDLGGRTRYTARALHWTDADREKHEKMGFDVGWNLCLDQLERLVTGK